MAAVYVREIVVPGMVGVWTDDGANPRHGDSGAMRKRSLIVFYLLCMKDRSCMVTPYEAGYCETDYSDL